jgi:diacylglycerol kinase (ATP)
MKPKYNFFKNSRYAVEGLLEMIKSENSFRLQLLSLITFVVIALLLPISLVAKAILTVSMFIPILFETVNSAIERAVDLVTDEYHPVAKQAKDIGSSAVFISILFTVAIWGWTLYIELLSVDSSLTIEEELVHQVCTPNSCKQSW